MIETPDDLEKLIVIGVFSGVIPTFLLVVGFIVLAGMKELGDYLWRKATRYGR